MSYIRAALECLHLLISDDYISLIIIKTIRAAFLKHFINKRGSEL